MKTKQLTVKGFASTITGTKGIGIAFFLLKWNRIWDLFKFLRKKNPSAAGSDTVGFNLWKLNLHGRKRIIRSIKKNDV